MPLILTGLSYPYLQQSSVVPKLLGPSEFVVKSKGLVDDNSGIFFYYFSIKIKHLDWMLVLSGYVRFCDTLFIYNQFPEYTLTLNNFHAE